MLFQKFAIIICSTIGISFLTSMLFFGALLHTFGPQNGWCDLCSCWLDIEEMDFKVKQEVELEKILSQPKSFMDLVRDG